MSHYKPDPKKNVNLTINGIPVTVPEGTRILEAARKVGVKIPTLCEHPDICKNAVCRICTVECDGRGKLIAACANDVWEGVNIVTNNLRILEIRKTIIELILANHPQDCTDCPKNKNCSLQTIAADFGIRKSPFPLDPIEPRPAAQAQTLVFDMGKCIKCGRCVEACQEMQAVRAINTSGRGGHYRITVPYNDALEDSPCVFCGLCAELCPVGAIYAHNDTEKAWKLINDKNCFTAAQFDPSICGTLEKIAGLHKGTVTEGKIASALKLMGINKVFDGRTVKDLRFIQECNILLDRIKGKAALPMISGSSPGISKFVEYHYPDLLDRLCHKDDKGLNVFFRCIIKKFWHSIDWGLNPEKISCISIEQGIAQKFTGKSPEINSAQKDNIVLTVNELALMLRQKGINIKVLDEAPFDLFNIQLPEKNKMENISYAQHEIEQSEIILSDEIRAKMLTVHGLSNARPVLDSISKGECKADWIKIELF